MAELPYLELDQVAILFKYRNRETCRKAATRGTLPVKTYKLAGRLVVDREVVRAYFRKMRDEGLRTLEAN